MTLEWRNAYCYTNRRFICKNLFYEKKVAKKIKKPEIVKYSKEEIANILAEVREYVEYWDHGTNDEEMATADETKA